MSDNEQLIIPTLFRKETADTNAPLSSEEIRSTVRAVFGILYDNGLDPIRQISGYIVSDDPAYIPDYDNARVMFSKIDRDTLISELIKYYVSDNDNEVSDEAADNEKKGA